MGLVPGLCHGGPQLLLLLHLLLGQIGDSDSEKDSDRGWIWAGNRQVGTAMKADYCYNPTVCENPSLGKICLQNPLLVAPSIQIVESRQELWAAVIHSRAGIILYSHQGSRIVVVIVVVVGW